MKKVDLIEIVLIFSLITYCLLIIKGFYNFLFNFATLSILLMIYLKMKSFNKNNVEQRINIREIERIEENK